VGTEQDPRDEFGMSETEVVDVVSVGVMRHSDLFVPVASDDVFAASTEGHVQQHGQMAEQAGARVIIEVKFEDITTLI